MKTFAKMIVAAIVALFMACVAIAYNASDNLVFCTLFTVGIAVSALLGVFDMPERKGKHMSLKDAARSFEQAA